MTEVRAVITQQEGTVSCNFEEVQCDGGAITPGDDYLLRERPCGVHG